MDVIQVQDNSFVYNEITGVPYMHINNRGAFTGNLGVSSGNSDPPYVIIWIQGTGSGAQGTTRIQDVNPTTYYVNYLSNSDMVTTTYSTNGIVSFDGESRSLCNYDHDLMAPFHAGASIEFYRFSESKYHSLSIEIAIDDATSSGQNVISGQVFPQAYFVFCPHRDVTLQLDLSNYPMTSAIELAPNFYLLNWCGPYVITSSYTITVNVQGSTRGSETVLFIPTLGCTKYYENNGLLAETVADTVAETATETVADTVTEPVDETIAEPVQTQSETDPTIV